MRATPFDGKFLGEEPYFKLEPTGMLVEFAAEHCGHGRYALDVGCGNGRNACVLASAGYVAVGVDISPTALRVARRIAPNALFVRSDVISLPFRDRIFAVAFCGTVLSCLDESGLARAIIELSRVTMPGGYFLLTDFSVDDPGASGPDASDASECSPFLKHYFEPTELQKILAGFSIERMWKVRKLDDTHGPTHTHVLVRLVARRNTGDRRQPNTAIA